MLTYAIRMPKKFVSDYKNNNIIYFVLFEILRDRSSFRWNGGS